MNTIDELDVQLKQISLLAKASSRSMDRLVEVCDSIKTKTDLIQQDCQKWERVRRNVADTIVESIPASRCYHIPSYLFPVLQRTNRNAGDIAKSIEYLTFVINYCYAHLPEDIKTIEKAEQRLAHLGTVVLEEIKDTLLQGMGVQSSLLVKETTSNTHGVFGGSRDVKKAKCTKSPGFHRRHVRSLSESKFVLNTPRTSLIPLPGDEDYETSIGHSRSSGVTGAVLSLPPDVFPVKAALKGLDDLNRTAFGAFEESTDLFGEEIILLILERCKTLLDGFFDTAYYEEYEPAVSSGIIQAVDALTGKPILLPGSSIKGRTNGGDLVTSGSCLICSIDSVFSPQPILKCVRTQATEALPHTRVSPLSSSAPLASNKHYRKGSHPLLSASRAARSMALEVNETLNEILLLPLENDALVAESPCMVASALYKCILVHLRRSIYLPECLFSLDSTAVFLMTGGIGASVASKGTYSRSIRDTIFIGLDMIEELWKWKKDVAPCLHGDKEFFVKMVGDQLEEVCKEILETVDKYCTILNGDLRDDVLTYIGDCPSFSKSSSSVALLQEIFHATAGPQEYHVQAPPNPHQLELFQFLNSSSFHPKVKGTAVHRAWMPFFDCSPHESTVNCMYTLRTIFTHFYGSFKLTLNRGSVEFRENDSKTKANAMRVESFIVENIEKFLGNIFENHIRNLRVIACSAMQLQIKHADDENSSDDESDQNHRINPYLFILNNICYMIQQLQSNSCFTSRTKTVRQIKSSTGRTDASIRRKKSVEVKICQESVDLLQGEISGLIASYEKTWESCFPSPPSVQSSGPFSKKERMTLKKHHKTIRKQLMKAIGAARHHVVQDSKMKLLLVEKAKSAVYNGFQQLENVCVRGREWSTRPLKWLKNDVTSWMGEVNRIL
eukprot:Tbor_TRINITY_DN5090_c0_g1::TRINITY_DN5090_c0_g1_i1::g.14075::m.14075